MTWAERAAERSPMVKRSRARGVEQAKAIVEAAQRLIDEKEGGFTTQELVKEAGIALQTFYRYFEGKDHLILAVLEHIISESVVGYKQAVADVDDPVARLRSYVEATITGLSSAGPEAKLPRFMTSEHWRLQSLYPVEVAHATKPFTDLIRDDLAAAAEAGRARIADPEYTAWLVTQLVMGVFHHYAFAAADEPYEVVSERVWTFCANAMCVTEPDPVPAGPGRRRRLDRN